MSYFIRSGNSYRVSSEEAMDLHDMLPAGNYTIKMDMFENFYLEMVDSFKPLSKYYGDTVRNTGRILNTFADREYSTGVMLNGEKGSGKTLLAKNLSIEAGRQGIPTIIINSPWVGDKFNKFLQDIEQPCVILFDEFEKVYDNDHQEAALTLLDGVFPSKKLFVITCNDKWRVNEHMRNRPGRIFYMLDFTGLSADFIMEYCDDNLRDKEHAQKICEIAALFDSFNFDMLKALVEEMNRYGETPQDALKFLNAKPEYANRMTFDCKLLLQGVEVPAYQLETKAWSGNPLTGVIYMEWDDSNTAPTTMTGSTPKNEVALSGGDGWHQTSFTPNHIKKVDAMEGRFTYVNENNETLVMTRSKGTSYNYLAM